VRSGSKVGSRYKALKASTNDEYCPTIRAITRTRLPEDVNAVYEIVIDALDAEAVRRAMAVGIRAACREGVRVIRRWQFTEESSASTSSGCTKSSPRRRDR